MTVSLRRLFDEQEERRKQEILAARRRQLAAERLETEERARSETEARRRAAAAVEASRQMAARQREEQVRIEASREAEFERARIRAELEAKLAVIAAERASDEARLAIQRDHRIGRLGTVAFSFAALSVALALAGAGSWLFVLRPAEMGLKSQLAWAKQALLEAREDSARQVSDLKKQLERTERRIRELETVLRAVPQAEPRLPSHGAGSKPRQTQPPLPRPPCACHERDPLCEC